MTAARTFEDLLVWQKAHHYALSVYKTSESFPNCELYGLTSQMRRAAVSIPANIAEGFKKRGIRDKARFFNISQGSIAESRCYLLLARDLGYVDTTTLLKDLEEVSRLLERYAQRILSSDS